MSNVNCEAIQNHEKEIDSKITTKSQFIEILKSMGDYDTFENIITSYIHRFGNTISADQCCQIIELLSNILYPKIAELNSINRIERAIYLEKYLDGKNV